MSEQLTITRLGRRGDGVAETDEGLVHVPYALPGEVVIAEIAGDRARLVAVEAPAPERREPFCPYFGRCGGCATQHMDAELYRRWKRDMLMTALTRAGIEAPVGELIDAHGAGRRRLILHARRIDGRPAVGFMAARSHELVAIDHCPISLPALARAPAVGRALAAAVNLRKPLDIQITATEGGLDVDLRGLGPLANRERQALVGLAERLDLARLSHHGELVVERRPPALVMGRARVVPPPGGFLQATAAGEEALARIVTEAFTGRKRVADLFAGCGTFTLRLAERAEVHAVESHAPALAALDKAVRAIQGLKPITTEVRDLFRRPLLPLELDRFDAVVFDPPRAGAEAQARQIAASKLRHVLAVSCDAGSFTRDLAILIVAGFRVRNIIVLDQFRHSPHMEIVGILER
ncbi:class I SAM-dependent RNA methyltransferase [Chelatococcus sp. GCM10030263]|uniref:class I SAM-dependent RNA methyltransferase n=1 Tax=Chelatococcus sp. GCM10030263 TaxID=3273387 RepID=UPI003608819A